MTHLLNCISALLVVITTQVDNLSFGYWWTDHFVLGPGYTFCSLSLDLKVQGFKIDSRMYFSQVIRFSFGEKSVVILIMWESLPLL